MPIALLLTIAALAQQMPPEASIHWLPASLSRVSASYDCDGQAYALWYDTRSWASGSPGEVTIRRFEIGGEPIAESELLEWNHRLATIRELRSLQLQCLNAKGAYVIAEGAGDLGEPVAVGVRIRNGLLDRS